MKEKIENYFDRLWPICRSITGNGLRESFRILQELCPLQLHEVPSGTEVLDWVVPKEWNIQEAWIKNSNGDKVIDFSDHNLHIVGYSIPVDQKLLFKELKGHLHTLTDMPEAIPYVTSYYKERWGFCMTQNQLDLMDTEDTYHVYIDSSLTEGSLTYGDCVLESTRSKPEGEVLLTSYLCHPSMANNELSGPLALCFLYQELKKLPDRRFDYRFVIAPETIGAICYLSEHGMDLKKECVAGFVLTCCGGNNTFTYKKTRKGNHLLDLLVKRTSEELKIPLEVKEFFPFGSDERQYSSPGYDLPMGSVMRGVYGEYKEYHTSLDNRDFINFENLTETVRFHFEVLKNLECTKKYLNLVPYGEPMLGKHGLYPNLSSQSENIKEAQKLLWILNFSDSQHTLFDIAQKSGMPIQELHQTATKLKDGGLLKEA